jgi:hypothetical protein
VNAASGGTGRSNPTAHTVPVAEGANAFNMISPGSAGGCFISNGVSADPTFQACPGGTITLPVTVAGTVTSGGVPYFNSTTQESSSAALATGQFVLGGGAGNPPATSFSVVPVVNGGTGVANPTAHYTAVAEGASVFTFITPGSAGGCYISNGTSADPSFQACPGLTNPMSTLGDTIYGGAAGAPTRLAGPTTPNSVPELLTSTPSGGAATAPAWALAGVPFDVQSGASPSVVATDRTSLLQTTNNTTSTAVTVPQAGTTGFASNFAFVHCNTGSVVATDTPQGTSTVNGNSNLALLGKVAGANPECAFWWGDNANYWSDEILPTDSSGRLHASGFPAITGDTTVSAGTLTSTTSALHFGASGISLGVAPTNGQCLEYNGSNITGAACGTPIFPATVAGTVTSGGIPYFNATTQMSSTALLPAGDFVLGGGAGNPPTATFSVVPIANGGTGVSSTSFTSLTTTCAGAQTWAIASAWIANATITITGACTLNITNPLAGGNYVLIVTQGAGGSHTLALGTGCTWKVSGGGAGAVTPSTAAGAIDVLAFTYDGTANCYANYNKNFN